MTFSDDSLYQAETALIQQLNNLSHTMKMPARNIFDAVLDSKTREELDAYFNDEGRVAEVADATVRALCAIYLCQSPGGSIAAPFHVDAGVVWSELRDHDELADWYESNEDGCQDPNCSHDLTNYGGGPTDTFLGSTS